MLQLFLYKFTQSSLTFALRMSIDEQQLLKQISFLENCLQTNKKLNDLEVYGRSESPKIRHLAALLAIETYGTCADIVSFDDPCYLVRSVALLYCRDLSILQKHLKDSNSPVRLSVLKSLYQINLSESQQNELILQILPFVNDKELAIRHFFSKLLAKFTLISSQIVLKMFEKEDIGTFIYGAEDEAIEARIQLIKSMDVLITDETALCAFEFLCDLLNDDSIEVRSVCIKLLYRISKKYKIQRDSKNLFGLIFCSREKNRTIKKYLFKTLSNIRYSEISMVRQILNLFDSTEMMLVVLKKIIKMNISLFEEELMSKTYLFSTEKQRKKYEKEYLCDLLTIKEVMKYEPSTTSPEFHIILKHLVQIDKKLKKDFKRLNEVFELHKSFKGRVIKQFLEIFELENMSGTRSFFQMEDIKPENNECDYLRSNANNDASDKVETGDSKYVSDTSIFIQELIEKIKSIKCTLEFEKILKKIVISVLKDPKNIYLFYFKLGFKMKKLKKYNLKYNPNFQKNQSLIILISKLLKLIPKNTRKYEALNFNIYLLSCHYSQNANICEFRFEIEYPSTMEDIYLVLEQNNKRLIFPLGNQNSGHPRILKESLFNHENDSLSLNSNHRFRVTVPLCCKPLNTKYYLGTMQNEHIIEISNVSEIL